MNSVSLLGRVLADPEHKALAGGRTVCNFVLELRSRYDAASGEKREDVTEVDCVAWRGAADNIAKFVHAGDQIAVQGSLKTERWEWKGKPCSKLKVNVEKFELLGSREGKPAPRADGPPPERLPNADPGRRDDDDIPF